MSKLDSPVKLYPTDIKEKEFPGQTRLINGWWLGILVCTYAAHSQFCLAAVWSTEHAAALSHTLNTTSKG